MCLVIFEAVLVLVSLLASNNRTLERLVLFLDGQWRQLLQQSHRVSARGQRGDINAELRKLLLQVLLLWGQHATARAEELLARVGYCAEVHVVVSVVTEAHTEL